MTPAPDAAAAAAAPLPTLLPAIHSPADIRGLAPADLKRLSREIRDTILGVVSQNSAGGHLASSLGAVELTVALHHVYDTPRDRLVWDVGHQGYPHKLLTGRYPRFDTLRKTDGVSGFLRRDESPFDTFGAGHAGTSISAALGMAMARDVQGQDFKVVAVIGDGSMTCGLPFEGLNNAGGAGTDLLVVLNDNEMSISENVGGLSRAFNKIVGSRLYNDGKRGVKSLVEKAPGGQAIVKMVHRLEESTKGLIVPSLFFEDLGFRYVGPVDGHDMDELLRTLTAIRDNYRGPVLLHAVTTKGAGYKLAEGDPIFWHAPPNFSVDTGEYKKSTARSFTHVYGDTLCELAAADPSVVAITAAMATGTGLVPFSQKFPKRYFDVGIAEGHAVTAAAGMAVEGLRPFVTIYSTFLQRAYDNIMHDVALQRLPVIFCMDRAGLVGYDGPTHHGMLDIPYMRVIPGMTVMAPKDEGELRDMMLTAKNHLSGPTAIRYPRAGTTGADVERAPVELPIGKAEPIVEAPSPDPAKAIIISYGHVWGNVTRAAKLLADAGMPTAIVNARFAKPLDMDMIRDAATRFDLLFSVEDGTEVGGFGSAVNEALAEIAADNAGAATGETGGAGAATKHCTIIAVPDRFIEHGDQPSQHEEAGISPTKIAARVRDALTAAGFAPASTASTGAGGLAEAGAGSDHGFGAVAPPAAVPLGMPA